MVGLANSERLARRIAGVRTGFNAMPNSRDECSNRREISETLFFLLLAFVSSKPIFYDHIESRSP